MSSKGSLKKENHTHLSNWQFFFGRFLLDFSNCPKTRSFAEDLAGQAKRQSARCGKLLGLGWYSQEVAKGMNGPWGLKAVMAIEIGYRKAPAVGESLGLRSKGGQGHAGESCHFRMHLLGMHFGIRKVAFTSCADFFSGESGDVSFGKPWSGRGLRGGGEVGSPARDSPLQDVQEDLPGVGAAVTFFLRPAGVRIRSSVPFVRLSLVAPSHPVP